MSLRSKPGVYVAGFSAAGLFCTYCALSWVDFVATVGFCSELFCDFIGYYYPMGEAILTTAAPVEGFLYSPLSAIIMAVFPLLGLELSVVVWGIAQVIAILVYLYLFQRLVPAGFGTQLLFIALTVSSYPLWLNFLAGNTGAFIVVALLGLLLAIDHNRYAAAAILLAFAASFKFYPLIFVAPFIARRHGRYALLVTLVSVLLLVVIPGVVLGAGGVMHYYEVLLNSFQDSDWVVANPHSQFLPHVLLRLIGGPLAVWYVLSYGLAAGNLLLIYFIRRARVPYSNLWCFQILFLTIPFVLKTSWPIDFIFLPFIQAFMLWRLTAHRSDSEAQGRQGAQRRKLISALLVVVTTILTNVLFFDLWDDFALYGYCGFLLLADILLLTIIYAELSPALRSVWRRTAPAHVGTLGQV